MSDTGNAASIQIEETISKQRFKMNKAKFVRFANL